ncbi:MAG: hypothetical protein FWF80_02220, partial [Defluviitaleaceae bacterium]|nr:hypothetical protein [Defluviitaleaceae bacterium]
PPSREAVLKVMTYAPEAIKHLYERPMQGFMSRDEVADVLKFFRNFLTENLDMLKRPAKRYMSDGAARTLTTLCNHFGMCSHEIYHIFDFLEESGVVARVTEPVRLSKNSKSTVEEVAFIYLGSCPDSSLTEVSCEENNRSNRRKSE